MSKLKEALYEGWRYFFKALEADDRQQLLKVLREEYLEEAQDVAQFSQHVKYMPYPQFRDSLRRLIAEEQAHVQWLRDKILALGSQIPAYSPVPKAGKNTWECPGHCAAQPSSMAILCRFSASVFGIVISRMPFLSRTVACLASTAAGRPTVRENAPKLISR
jgi:hypothetical protein